MLSRHACKQKVKSRSGEFRNNISKSTRLQHICGSYIWYVHEGKHKLSCLVFTTRGLLNFFFPKNRSSLKLPVRQTDLFGAFVLRSQGTCMVRYRDNQRKWEFFGVLRDSFVYNLPHIFRKERKSSDGLLPSHFSISTSVNKLYLVLHLTVIADLLLTL